MLSDNGRRELGEMPAGSQPVVVPLKSCYVDGLTLGLQCLKGMTG